MGIESLQAAITRAGSPVELLRGSIARPHVFPVAPEFTNWRSEQQAWRASCALLDQSHHMTDLFIGGPDALRLLSDFGVNSFANFAPGMAKQYVAVNAAATSSATRSCSTSGTTCSTWSGIRPSPTGWSSGARAGRYDVTLERDDNSHVRVSGPPRLYRYELQGPTAGALVAKLTGRRCRT